MVIGKIWRTATAVAALGVFLAAAPVGFDFGGNDGIGLHIGKAFAKDGDSGNGGQGNDDRGGGDNGGRGGDDRGGDDNGGRGGDDRGGDDNGGRGNDDRGGGDNGGRGGDDRGGGGGDDGGRGRGGDDARADDRNGAAQGGATAPGGDLRVVKIERSASGIEIIYSNGVKEEIENGRYQLKNPGGRTIAQRPATQGDLNRIGRNVRNSGLAPPRPAAVAGCADGLAGEHGGGFGAQHRSPIRHRLEGGDRGGPLRAEGSE